MSGLYVPLLFGMDCLRYNKHTRNKAEMVFIPNAFYLQICKITKNTADFTVASKRIRGVYSIAGPR